MKHPLRLTFLLCMLPGSIYVAAQDAAADASKPATAAPAKPQDLPDGNTAVAAMNENYLKMRRTLMAPKDVADTFGSRIAKSYIAIQITIYNRNKDYQWLIQDASIDLHRLLKFMLDRGFTNTGPNACTGSLQSLAKALSLQSAASPGDASADVLAAFHSAVRELSASKLSNPDLAKSLEMIKKAIDDETRANSMNTLVSSADLTMLRGVAEKGQSLDPRNITFRSLTGAGIIASGLIGVAKFGPSFAPAVAAFNGPLLNAFQTTFPDYTVNQMNRLNDSAYLANTVVGKQQAKVIAIFIPQSYLLTKSQQAIYYKDPESVYGCTDLRLLGANVDGNFISNITTDPNALTVNIAAKDSKTFQKESFTINGTITGHFLAKATVDLVAPPDGLSVKLDGTPTDTSLAFILTGTQAVEPQKLIVFAVKGPTGNAVNVNYTVNYAPDAPTLTKISPDPCSVKAGGSMSVTLTGTNFLGQNATRIWLDPPTGVTPSITEVKHTTITVTLAANNDATPGARKLVVSSLGGHSSGSLTCSVTK